IILVESCLYALTRFIKDLYGPMAHSITVRNFSLKGAIGEIFHECSRTISVFVTALHFHFTIWVVAFVGAFKNLIVLCRDVEILLYPFLCAVVVMFHIILGRKRTG